MTLTSGAQLRAGRALARLEKAELAKLAGVSPNTIAKMEAVDGPFSVRVSTARTVEAVLRERGVSFYNDEQPGARIDLSKRSAA